jgi:hypothetical protein
VVQPNLTWYRIPNKGDLHPSLTDGTRSFCTQHATAIALQAPVVLRAMHEPRSHVDGGICVFCGQHEWYTNAGAYICAACYPADFSPGAVRSLLDVATFPVVPESLLLKTLPRTHPDPITPEEQARQDQFSRDFIVWRNTAPSRS